MAAVSNPRTSGIIPSVQSCTEGVIIAGIYYTAGAGAPSGDPTGGDVVGAVYYRTDAPTTEPSLFTWNVTDGAWIQAT